METTNTNDNIMDDKEEIHVDDLIVSYEDECKDDPLYKFKGEKSDIIVNDEISPRKIDHNNENQNELTMDELISEKVPVDDLIVSYEEEYKDEPLYKFKEEKKGLLTETKNEILNAVQYTSEKTNDIIHTTTKQIEKASGLSPGAKVCKRSKASGLSPGAKACKRSTSQSMGTTQL